LSNKPHKPAALSKMRRADPRFEREKAKYEHPLPSREYILQTLAAQGAPLEFERLARLLDIQAFELEPFQRRLGAMAREAQLMQNRRGDWLIPDKADLVRGRVTGHPDGYGFLTPEEGGADLFLAAKEMDKVLHGDKVIARVIGVDRKGRPEGKIVDVTERANRFVVGRVIEEHGVRFVAAENKRISQDILLAPPEKGARKPLKAQAGQVVMVELIEQPSKHGQPIGRLVEVLGNYADPGMEIEIALRKHELPYEFSPAALGEAKKLPDAVRKSDWKGREDVTGLPLVTIDSETARDFDDAVYCQRKGKGFRLVVAIADVSHYVPAGGALDGGRPFARQLRLFSAARDSDAPGKDFQWPVLAESAGRALVHGLRHGDRRQRGDPALPFLSGGHVLPRAIDLHRGGGRPL
jgi:ribonuclease R